MAGFTHFDQNGNAIMVDVTAKADTERIAVATGYIQVNEEVFRPQDGSQTFEACNPECSRR